MLLPKGNFFLDFIFECLLALFGLWDGNHFFLRVGLSEDFDIIPAVALDAPINGDCPERGL
jgi:hypothetical protein